MNRRLFSPRGRDKLIWLVNLALLFAMTLCVASGIAISRVALPELGIESGRPGLFPGDLLEPVNLVVLRNSAFLEAVVITAVVITTRATAYCAGPGARELSQPVPLGTKMGGLPLWMHLPCQK